MKIGLLIIATEVLEGKIQDINTKNLALFLKKFHLEIYTSLVVRDIESEIQRGYSELLDLCDVVVTSGGLGPTKDDLTKKVLGDFLQTKMELSQEAMEVAQSNYKKFEREFPGKDHGYSYLPLGVKPLSNSTGFAPGLWTLVGAKLILGAPGVPREFVSMLYDHLAPYIKKHHLNNEYTGDVIIRTRGVPEEKIFGQVDIELWDKLEKFGSVSSLPQMQGVDVGVKIRASSEATFNTKKNQILNIIKSSPINEFIWHSGPEGLEEVIVKKSIEKKLKFGFAESATGGLCAHRITSVPGASQVFNGSIVSYVDSVKKNCLGVGEVSQFGAVSEQVAIKMAEGAYKGLGVDVAISITGLAGPGDDGKNPVGTVWIGWHTSKDCGAKTLRFYGDRERLKDQFSQYALFTLLEKIQN